MRKTPEEHPCRHKQGVSRRGFMASLGTGAVAAGAMATTGLLEAAPAGQTAEAGEMNSLSLVINGRRHQLFVSSASRLRNRAASAGSAEPAPCSSTISRVTPV
jgi:hypothetical protein